jgi:hypothetical protein
VARELDDVLLRKKLMPSHEPKLIADCCREVAGIAGDAAEIGVWKGEGAALICRLLPGSTVYLFDTFAGFPATMKSDRDQKWPPFQWGDTSEDEVRQAIQPASNFRLVKGVFPDSAAGLQPALKFVHIDVDLYKSTLAALEWAWPLLVPGGVILDDDYKCPSCPGALAAVNEFCQQQGIQVVVEGTRAILRRPK